MATESEVVWKCGSCDECFYDLQILASHKCLGNGGRVEITENCIKQLEVQSFDVADLSGASDQVQDTITSLNIIDANDIAELPFANASFSKPTIINVKKNNEFRKHQKGKRSIVWTYFTALDDKKAMCCICQKVISYCGTPTNLVYHLSRYHPAEGEVVRSKQANNVKYQYLSNKLPKPSIFDKKKGNRQTINLIPPITDKSPSLTIIPKKINVTDKIIEMMLVDMLPVNIIEGVGFKKMVCSLDPTYKIPSVKEFYVDHIPKKYYTEYKRVQNLLKEAEKVHASVELWTGYEDMKFITVSSHFVTEDFRYKNCALNTFNVTDLSPEQLMTHIVTSISQWDLSLDVMCIVAGGSEVISKASKLTGWKCIDCFAYILNDIIQTSLSASSELKTLIGKCRQVVSFVRNNEMAKQQLLETQMHDKNLKVQHAQAQAMDINAGTDVKYPLKVKKDNASEWISTFYMLQRIATLKNVLIKILGNFSSSVDILTRNDWTAIDETISLLKAFEVVILELCNEPYQFASKVIPVTLGLNSLVNNCNTLTLSSVEKVRKDILAQLRKRLGHVEHNLMLAMATILDPRFKNIAFQSETAIEAAIQELTVEASKEAVGSSLFGTLCETEKKEIPSSTDSLWEGFERKATPKKISAKADDIISSEIKHYLEEPLLDRKKNPCLWWKTQGQAQFPILSKKAKQILCIPATSIPPERVFLKKGRIFAEKRKSIKPKYVDQFIFLNQNID